MKISKNILFAAVFLILIFICAVVLMNRGGKYAKIYYSGKLYKTIDLSEVKSEYTIDIDGKNTVLVSHGEICMHDANCPDKLCVKQGTISNGDVPIVCLPNEIIIKIEE